MSPAREYTYSEVAERLNVSRNTIQRRVSSGLIGTRVIGGQRKITEQDLRAYEDAVVSGKIVGWHIRR